jgi:hypothetical protein
MENFEEASARGFAKAAGSVNGGHVGKPRRRWETFQEVLPTNNVLGADNRGYVLIPGWVKEQREVGTPSVEARNESCLEGKRNEMLCHSGH